MDEEGRQRKKKNRLNSDNWGLRFGEMIQEIAAVLMKSESGRK